MRTLLGLFSLFLIANTHAQVETEFSGNLEAQSRHVKNQEGAKKELLQNWNEEQFHLIYGNLNFKTKFRNSRLEANWFVRHSYSELYQNQHGSPLNPQPALATQIYTFPNTLVARDVFRLQYQRQENNYYTESILNKFYYEWDYDEHRFVMGRMYINYGIGEIFNPLNPFNQPTGLTFISQVAQGNDGFSFTFYVDEHHTISFYLLGDKRPENYSGQIDSTIWIHGEYQANEKLQLDYVIGEDQRRHKLGGQFLYRLDDANIFGQVLYQTENVRNKDQSHNLWDIMFGLDQRITGRWHFRTEAGYQKVNRFREEGVLGSRFLPTEYFIAFANQYEIHPLAKLSGTIVSDIKTGFAYALAKATFSVANNTEVDLFASVPVIKGDQIDNPAQKLVTTDLGLALRTFF
jgi:hypothetical protein